jgi:hypothetical protein
VFKRDGYRCVDCGTTEDLTADYEPGGIHSRNPDDYKTRCRSCHGRKDAPRAQEKKHVSLDIPEPRLLG